MERDLMLGKKQAESDKRDIENLNREKDILNKSMQKIQSEYLYLLLGLVAKNPSRKLASS